MVKVNKDKQLKVLLVNESPHRSGNTFTALSDIPPTFYIYGTEDPFYLQFIANANAVRDAGAQVEEHVLDGWPHGFGVQEEWTTGSMTF